MSAAVLGATVCLIPLTRQAQAEKEALRAGAAAAEAVHLRLEVAELQDSLNMAKSLFCRAAEADDLQEKLKARSIPDNPLHRRPPRPRYHMGT